MAVSIGQAQAKALADGFLNGIGSDKETFVPDESLTALINLAAIIITNSQINLRQSNQVSSGALSDSFKVLNPKGTPTNITLQIEAADYYDFQNKGVRGVGGGTSSGGYSFKNANPSPGMVKAIEEWIKRSGASTSIVPKQHTLTGHESKQKGISEINNAYAVARRIKIKGINGTGYFDKAVKVAQNYSTEVLGKALSVDIINVLPKKLTTNGNSNKQ